jgi:hypothetical protein
LGQQIDKGNTARCRPAFSRQANAVVISCHINTPDFQARLIWTAVIFNH